MNTLYKAEQGESKEQVYRNVTQFCCVGVADDPACPKNALPVPTGLFVPPGRAVRRRHGGIHAIVANCLDVQTTFFGPKDAVEKELEALRANGVKPVLDGKPADGTLSGYFLGHLGVVLKDITEDLKNATDGLLSDPDQVLALGKVQAEATALRAENAALRTELDALKKKKAQVIPRPE